MFIFIRFNHGCSMSLLNCMSKSLPDRDRGIRYIHTRKIVIIIFVVIFCKRTSINFVQHENLGSLRKHTQHIYIIHKNTHTMICSYLTKIIISTPPLNIFPTLLSPYIFYSNECNVHFHQASIHTHWYNDNDLYF